MGSPSLGGMQLGEWLGSQQGSAALQQRTEGRRAIYLPHHHTYTLEKTFGQKISWGLPENDVFLFEEQTTSVQNVVAMNCPRPSPVALPYAAAFSFQEEYRWIQDDSWAVKPSSFLHRKGLIFLLNPSVQSPGPGPLLQVYQAVDKLKQGHRPAWSSTSDVHPRPSCCVHPSPSSRTQNKFTSPHFTHFSSSAREKLHSEAMAAKIASPLKFLWLFLRQRRENGCM